MEEDKFMLRMPLCLQNAVEITPPAPFNFDAALHKPDHFPIVKDPSAAEVAASRDMISHEPDAPILVANIKVKTGCLVTLNRRHCIEDTEVARRAGLRIGTPGAALAWVRAELR